MAQNQYDALLTVVKLVAMQQIQESQTIREQRGQEHAVMTNEVSAVTNTVSVSDSVRFLLSFCRKGVMRVRVTLAVPIKIVCLV